MCHHGFVIDKFTYPFVVNASIASDVIGFGRVVHGFWSDVYVQNNMMKHERDVDDGWKLFDKRHVRNVVSWTSFWIRSGKCLRRWVVRMLFHDSEDLMVM
ncbi:unnamed protein product [Lathyrus oleraceus]